MLRHIAIVSACVFSLGGCVTAQRSTVTCKNLRLGNPNYAFNSAGGTSTAAAFPGAGEVLIAPALNEQIAVALFDIARTRTGLAEARVQFANCTSEDLAVRVRAQFTDGAGISSEPESMWREVFVRAAGIVEYREKAFSDRSSAARLEVDVPR